MLMSWELSLQRVLYDCHLCGTSKSALGSVIGLYQGYVIFFVQSALMIAGSRVIYRWQQAVPPKMGLIKIILVFLNFAYTLLVRNYSAVGFMVLSLHETLASYGSVYYVGTVLPVSSILLGYVIKPRKPTRCKAHKAQ